MTTTQIAKNVRPNHVAATVERDGDRVGHVILRGTKFAAFRKIGTDQDMRKMATGFATVQAAAAWVAESAV